ncbi:hypothetical protein EUTSA_v10029129mg [Eutrema salsugineum]|uniref:Ubiquitin-like protease family profile domain-containing protein n=1 Tax=Eutrema salsugineum TaxID=72664 RepID=V4L3Q9_EUTSA|nr:hypothetical protein EUTSA_v10029129mg [Eutrema salsugineum]
MLKKRTVADTTTRLKYACLAIIGAVLCPTNHSIKVKDEVALAQSTVAVKGFFHAVQLILVEAVPALMEVIQVNDSSSSSESEDGEDDDGETDEVSDGARVEDNTANQEHQNDTDKALPKPATRSDAPKLGFSPGHAREVDEEGKVDVFCIIPEAPDAVSFHEDLCWSDEEEDFKVDNMVRLIGEGFQFSKEMFKGGMTQAELLKLKNEKKEIREKKEKEKLVESISGMASEKGNQGYPVVGDTMGEQTRLQLAAIETTLKSAIGKMDVIEKDVAGYEENLKNTLDQKLKDMQEELLSNILGFLDKSLSAGGKTESTKDVSKNPIMNPAPQTHSDSRRLTTNDAKVDADAAIAAAVGMVKEMGDKVTRPNTNAGPSTSVLQMGNRGNADFRLQTASSEVGESNVATTFESADHKLGQSVVDAGVGIKDGDGVDDFAEDAANGNVLLRRDKRPCLQNSALTDYEIDKRVLTCTIGTNPFLCSPEQQREFFEKFVRLHALLKTNRTFSGVSVISLGDGTSVSSKDVLDIAERTKPMHSKMMDTLLLYVRVVHGGQFSNPAQNRTEFMETKFVAQLMKCWGKFSRLATKDRPRYVFGDGVMDYLEPWSHKNAIPERLYMPFNLDKEYWVAIFVDVPGAAMHILDCNTAFRTDAALKKDCMPLAQMLLYVLKQIPGYKRPNDFKHFAFNRKKGLPQNFIHTDLGVTSALLMMVHSVGGAERCRTLTLEKLTKDSQILAVKFYEEFDEGV